MNKYIISTISSNVVKIIDRFWNISIKKITSYFFKPNIYQKRFINTTWNHVLKETSGLQWKTIGVYICNKMNGVYVI